MNSTSGRQIIRDLVEGGSGHVHLLGICGVGVAGIAFLLKQRGFRVSGCDETRNHLADWLASNDITVLEDHDASHLDESVNWLARSAAVPEDAPELVHAGERKLPIFSRGEVLPALIEGNRSVAVAGSHGKTTTASFLVQLLHACGRDPSWCIGGDTPGVHAVAGVGADDIIVVEADESDGTLAGYSPDIAIVTNIESDHLEHYGGDDALDACFRRFVDQSSQVIYTGTDARAAAVCAEHPNRIRFGFDADDELRATLLEENGDGRAWLLEAAGSSGRVQSPRVIGRHNVSNALAAVAACVALGIDIDTLCEGLATLQLPRRRFEVLSDSRGLTLINDYAHHPTEIAALVKAAANMPHERLIAVFQPHRYTRTLALRDAFPSAFTGVDALVLLPVYAASETPLIGGSTWDLYAGFRGESSPCTPMVAESVDEAWAYLKRTLQTGDILLVIGAGDVEQLAWTAKASLEAAGDVARLASPTDLDSLPLSDDSELRIGEPLCDKTTLGLGGLADAWIDVGTVADFQSVLAWTHANAVPLTLIAGGSNVLVSDMGVRGITIKLTGPEFYVLEERDGLAIVGAAVPVNAMLDWMESQGMSGLEFMESIPGTLGGGMQMNAGAWGKCLGDQLAWIRCVDRAGSERRVPGDQLDLGYRRCEFLRDRYVIEAAFHVSPREREVITAERLEIRERRAWMAGHRSAGSFFKNPGDEKAGRLLEAVGMHGRRVGGAVIGTHHANFVIVENGATSADVRALTQHGRREVAERFAVELEPEVKYLT